MTPVIQCSSGNIHLFPRISFVQRRKIQLTEHNVSRNHIQSSSHRLLFPQSSLHPFQLYRSEFLSKHESGIRSIAAVGADITVEESNPAVPSEDTDKTAEDSENSVETSGSASSNPDVTSTAKSKRSRPGRKSEMPPVKDDDLIPGASFTGKVRSIQPFGAFVDFGAFTDGLVHVSQMSNEYVKDVGSLVSVGQEVKVKIVEANMETGRISLTMRDNDDARKMQLRRESPDGVSSGDRPRSSRRTGARSTQKRDEEQKRSNFVKGQVLNGTVKNIIRSGSFVSLPDGEEGFIPVAEESEGFGNIPGNSSLQVGQEVSARVLRISRGKVTLTMKKEEDVEELNRQLNKGVWHAATNPFELAFRQNKDIAAFLDKQEETQKSSEMTSLQENMEIEDKADDAVSKSSSPVTDGSTTSEEPVEATSSVASSSVELVSGDQIQNVNIVPDISTESNAELSEVAELDNLEDTVGSNMLEKFADETSSTYNSSTELVSDVEPQSVNAVPETLTKSEEFPEVPVQDAVEDLNAVVDTAEEQVKSSEVSITDKNESVVELATSEGSDAIEANDADTKSAEISGDQEVRTVDESAETDTVNGSVAENAIEANDADTKSAEVSGDQEVPTVDESAETDTVNGSVSENATVMEVEASSASLSSQEIGQSPSPVTGEGSALPALSEQVPQKGGSIEADGENTVILEEDTSSTSLSSQENVDSAVPVTDDVPQEGDSLQADPAVVLNLELPVSEQNEVADEVKTETPETSIGQSGNPDADTAKATISPALVKQLREETGAGMMDCKKALSETGGDIVKAQEFLRKKGLASADKKASRATAEGRVGSYIHDSRIGVLVEVNCETDFVSRGEIFKQLVDDLAMQVAACPQVRYLVTEDVPEETVNKEREIEMQKEDLLKKPENIRSKIVDGRIRKRLEEFALLEQPYIKNDKMIVKDWVKQTIATIGENIKVRRFVRYNLGEGLEKKSQDFAAEVAAQTVVKESPAADQSVKSSETIEKAPPAAVSATLVKQLREETGAGMMDCKKALTETGGDLQKAQEYLQKKGLSSADKKSSRLAAEGRISAYIHDARIGCLIEVNSETDFVARNERFKELADDLAMQVVACPQVEFVSVEDIPEDIVKKEKQLERQREDLQSKPDNIREKIVEGRISKRLGELALLEQPFIKDDKVMVKDLVKQTVAALGENIKVRRFVRFTLGETMD